MADSKTLTEILKECFLFGVEVGKLNSDGITTHNEKFEPNSQKQQIEQLFKDKMMELLEDEPTTITIKATSPVDAPDEVLLQRRLIRNECRQSLRKSISEVTLDD